MKFSDWLNKKLKQEDAAAPAASSCATTTASIAGYPRPAMFVTRGDLFPRKRKKKV